MIIRVEHIRSYVVIQNTTLRDRRLSFRARGVLAYLLSLPDGATIARHELARVGPDGEDAVRRALAELVATGYLERREVRDAAGRFATETILREEPLEVVPGGLDPSLPDQHRRSVSAGRTAGGKPPTGRPRGKPATGGGKPPTGRHLRKRGKTAGRTAGGKTAGGYPTSKREVPAVEVPIEVPALTSLAGTLTAALDPARTKRDGSTKPPKARPKAKPPPHRDRLALRLWERFPDLDYDGALGMVNELRALDVADVVIDEGIGYTLQRDDINSPRFLVSVVTDWFNQRTRG